MQKDALVLRAHCSFGGGLVGTPNPNSAIFDYIDSMMYDLIFFFGCTVFLRNGQTLCEESMNCHEPSSGEDSLCQALHHTLESRKTRAKLTETDALDIFHCKAHLLSATCVAKKYGVSEKAVRDIWTGRTWSKETWHLDTSRSRPLKKMGRPVGRKDAKPRKSRIVPRKLEPTKLHDVAVMTSSDLDRHDDKSVDEQLHEWYLRCGFDCDFQDPFCVGRGCASKDSLL